MIDFLMTGDLGKEGADALIRTGYPLDAEILKVGHHGSSSSTSPAFLARVLPETAVIPVGAENDYGHPHTETLALLEENGVTVYRTDRNGTILVRSDGMSYSVKAEVNTTGTVITTHPAQTSSPELLHPLRWYPSDYSGDVVVPCHSLSLRSRNWTVPTLPAVPQIGTHRRYLSVQHSSMPRR
jgi:hypothetical protein